MNEFVEWGSLLNIVVFGLLVGAGVPAVYALGVRAVKNVGARDDAGRLPLWRKAVAVLCFGVCVAVVVTGVVFIAAGGH